MRLTLRTLLAYLDDVLEPAEAQDLGSRIQESEFATSLVHRIREAMRREKLGAPRLQGRAAGLDPNTVAEYLDNTLSSERVVDFEKYCLESEVHLSETACCHQVLALVLGEPALVDPDARRRIYGLLAHHDAHPKSAMQVAQTAAVDHPAARLLASDPLDQLLASSATAAPSAMAAASAAPQAMRKRAEVPDYLRQEALGLSAWWKLAAAVLVAVLLVCAAVMAVGPLWRNDKSTSDASISLRPNGALADLGPSHGGKSADPLVDPAAKGAQPTKSEDPAAVKPPLGDPAKGQGDKKPTIDLGTKDPAVSVEPLPPPLEVEPVIKTPPAKAALAETVGQLTLAERKSVLFRLDGAGRWSRLSVPSPLQTGDVLLCPPACRNTLLLRGDVQAQTVGETRLEFQAAPPGSPPGIHLHYGRLLLTTAGEGRVSMPLRAGDRTAKITFTKPGSALALEARLVREPGSDPEKVRTRTVIDLFAVGTGSIVWEDGNSPAITVDAPGRRVVGLAEGEAQPDGPALWVTPELLSITEQLGFNFVEPKLTGESADHLAKALPEFIFAQQREAQALAYRWLVSIDQFDDALRSLGQSKNRESHFWAKNIEHLRLAIARNPQTAAKVREALERSRGDKAAGLYRMLWGYTEPQLIKGEEAKRLVGYLEHEDLDYRVVASWSLGEIAGTGIVYGVGYRPDGPTESRSRDPFVVEWKKKLSTGKVIPPKKKP